MLYRNQFVCAPKWKIVLPTYVWVPLRPNVYLVERKETILVLVLLQMYHLLLYQVHMHPLRYVHGLRANTYNCWEYRHWLRQAMCLTRIPDFSNTFRKQCQHRNGLYVLSGFRIRLLCEIAVVFHRRCLHPRCLHNNSRLPT